MYRVRVRFIARNPCQSFLQTVRESTSRDKSLLGRDTSDPYASLSHKHCLCTEKEEIWHRRKND